MTTETLSQAARTRVDRLLATRVTLTPEGGVYAALLLAALVLRTWDLGTRAYHHDESIHAQWAWNLLRGEYTHSPIFHGPLYYHVQALVFFVTGASDVTGRLSAVLFGMAMTAAPLLLRRRLGTAGTIAAVALIAFSPTLVYFSRFFREDIYVAVFVCLMAIGMVRYLDEGRARWLVAVAAGFTGAVLTKEGAFLTTAIFLVYLDVVVAVDLDARVRGLGRAGRFERASLFLATLPVAWAIAGLWPFLGRLRRAAGWGDQLPRSGDALVLLGTLALPLLTPASRKYILEPLDIVAKDELSWELKLRQVVDDGARLKLLGLFAMTLSVASFAGLNWRPRLWVLVIGACTFAYLALMTSLFTNGAGLVSGPWGSLDYWITQQGEARGDQPWFYYYMLMPVYEFLPLLIAVGGLWWTVARGDRFTRLLALWAAGQWLVLSWASEKMPWNNTHIALPVALLAAATVQRAWAAAGDRRGRPELWLTATGVAGVSAAALLVVAWPPEPAGSAGARIAILAAAAAVVGFAAWPHGRRLLPALLVAAAVGGLSFFSVRTTIMATFERADDPRDLLIYTQSSGELARVARDIDRLAEASGKGRALKVAVDGSDSFAWPWAWYLRDYGSVSYPDFSSGNLNPAEYDVLLVNAANLNRLAEAISQVPASPWGEPERYPHRWWFDEIYKSALDTGHGSCTALSGRCGPFRRETWRTIAENVLDGSWPKTWLRFIRDHDTGRPNGSVDAYALFPAAFDRATGRFTPGPVVPAGPGRDDAGRLTLGSWGTQPGQFLEPVDVAVDGAGNVYVIDRSRRQLQKFDPEGRFVAGIDIRLVAGDPNEASEPWGLALGPAGEVIVADTFGWRMRIFDANLQPLATFGQPPDLSKAPGPFDLFGPRDAIVAPDGTLWVTDTGNDRIVVYTLGGEFVRVIGSSGKGPGQFDEPVGLALSLDGVVLVADMYNARVQILDGKGAPVGAFKVEGWGGQEVYDKPYLAALRDGRVAVGLPLANEVRIYRRDGTVDAVIGADAGIDRPYGLAVTADDRLWVTEGGKRQVRLFEIP